MKDALWIRVGGTGLLAGDTTNGVHVVVTHVSSLSGLVLRVHGQRQVLWVHCCDFKKGNKSDIRKLVPHRGYHRVAESTYIVANSRQRQTTQPLEQ